MNVLFCLILLCFIRFAHNYIAAHEIPAPTGNYPETTYIVCTAHTVTWIICCMRVQKVETFLFCSLSPSLAHPISTYAFCKANKLRKRKKKILKTLSYHFFLSAHKNSDANHVEKRKTSLHSQFYLAECSWWHRKQPAEHGHKEVACTYHELHKLKINGVPG